MKRSTAIILVILIIAGALTGCGPDQDKIQGDFLDILEQRHQKRLLSRYLIIWIKTCLKLTKIMLPIW